MNPRKKRRTRRTQSPDAAALQHISHQLSRLQAPSDPQVLSDINDKLGRIEHRLNDVQADATRRGAIAGAITGSVAGGIVATAIMLIKARLMVY